MSKRYDNLLRFTETYKMLFIPYLKLHEEDAYNLLYTDVLSRAIVNAYPAWEEVDATVENGFIFVVFRRDLLDEDTDEFGELINLDIVADYWMEDDLAIFAFELDEVIALAYFEGRFSEMFDKDKLKFVWEIFHVQNGGIMTPVPAGIKNAKLAKEYHILTRSKQYERIIAAKLGVPFSDFEGELKELKSRLSDDIESETLDTNLLMKQLNANGNT